MKVSDTPPGPEQTDMPPVSGEDPVLPVNSDPSEPSGPLETDPPSPPPAYPSVELAAEWADNGLSVGRTSYQNTFKQGGAETLTADGSFPQTGAAVIDAYYAGCRDDFERLCEARAEDAARDTTPYRIDADFTVECSAGGILSVSRHISQFSGGAHGSTAVYCETFSVGTGRLLTLDDFFAAGREEYTARLLESVLAVIDARPGEFWPDAKQLAEDLFPYDTFCITKDGVSLFFPEYNIAPFAAGTVRVDVPWGAVADIFTLPG
jgi:hypothetical protein